MTIAREEIFGPVLVVIPYRTEDEAVAIANGTAYGLGGYCSRPIREKAHSVGASNASRPDLPQRSTKQPRGPDGRLQAIRQWT